MQAKYKIGYVQGTFDLFHIGHLKLLQRAKAKCEYLIVGVVTDELNMLYKGKLPFISFADRSIIVESSKYVDKVIKVDINSDDKIDIWGKYHYDCHFSGDDHVNECDDLIKELRKRGSNMEFFPYTKKTSSTKIKRALRDKIFYGLAADFECENLPSKVALYGAGRLGQDLRAKLVDNHKEIIVWADKNYKKSREKGFLVVSPQSLVKYDFDKILIAVLQERTAKEVIAYLLESGVPQNKIIWVQVDK